MTDQAILSVFSGMMGAIIVLCIFGLVRGMIANKRAAAERRLQAESENELKKYAEERATRRKKEFEEDMAGWRVDPPIEPHTKIEARYRFTAPDGRILEVDTDSILRAWNGNPQVPGAHRKLRKFIVGWVTQRLDESSMRIEGFRVKYFPESYHWIQGLQVCKDCRIPITSPEHHLNCATGAAELEKAAQLATGEAI